MNITTDHEQLSFKLELDDDEWDGLVQRCKEQFRGPGQEILFLLSYEMQMMKNRMEDIRQAKRFKK